MTKDEPRSPSETPQAGSGPGESFCTAKHAILRSLAAVYAVAFLAAWQQNGALIGEKGLVPAKPAFDRERAAATSALEGFMSKPSLFLLFWWPALRHIPRGGRRADPLRVIAHDARACHPVTLGRWLPMDDASLDGVSAAGLALSLLVLLGLHSSVAMLTLWLLYFTVVSPPQP